MTQTQQTQTATAILERRSEPRLKANHPVILRASNGHPIEACVLDISCRGARLRTSEPIPAELAIKIDAQQMQLFGTVTRCEPVKGAYEIGVLLAQPLDMLDELRKLNSALLTE